MLTFLPFLLPMLQIEVYEIQIIRNTIKKKKRSFIGEINGQAKYRMSALVLIKTLLNGAEYSISVIYKI